MKKTVFGASLGFLLCVYAVQSLATNISTADPSYPASFADIDSSPLRDQFDALINDIDNLWAAVGPNILEANQLFGALVSGKAVPLPVPSCFGPADALIWIPGTGFGCNSISAGGGSLGPAGAYTVLAGPLGGAPAAASFRALTGNDLPLPTSNSIGGVESGGPVTHEFVTGISTSGILSFASPAFSDISGVASAAQLPTPTASSIGGTQSIAVAPHNWVTGISLLGVPSQSQPAFSDISGNIAVSQMASGSGASASTFWNGAGSWLQPSFSSLSGNISVSQMNSGTGASSNSYWRGDNVWATPPGGAVPVGATNALQSNAGSGSFGGSGSGNGLYISTTNPTAINYLNNTSSGLGNLISLPDTSTGVDATSLAIGPSALANQTSVNLGNVAIGYQAGYNITNRPDETLLGYQAGMNLTTTANEGNHNGPGDVVVGYQAGQTMQTSGTSFGGANTYIGYQSGQYTTTVDDNTCVGARACQNYIQGGTITALGSGAFVAGCGGGAAVYIGVNAGGQVGTGGGGGGPSACGSGGGESHGNNMTVVGGFALSASGRAGGVDSDTIIGATVGSNLVTGQNDIIIGTGYAFPNGEIFATSATSGATLIGHGVSGGTNDVAYGESALHSTSTDNLNNTGIGYNGLTALTTGKDNVSVGFEAGQLIATGSNNTVIGALVGSATLTTGSNDVLIGNSAAIDATTSSASNEIHIGGMGGDWAKVTGTNANSTEATTINGTLAITGAGVVIGATNTPADNATCTAGTIWWDTGFLYLCTSSGTVKRTTLSTY